MITDPYALDTTHSRHILRTPSRLWLARCDCGWHGHAAPEFKFTVGEIRRHQKVCPYPAIKARASREELPTEPPNGLGRDGSEH